MGDAEAQHALEVVAPEQVEGEPEREIVAVDVEAQHRPAADDVEKARQTVVGRVGTTGYTIGSCLHFEVRINGTQINPLPWLEANLR